jgi:hypothetical protein
MSRKSRKKFYANAIWWANSEIRRWKDSGESPNDSTPFIHKTGQWHCIQSILSIWLSKFLEMNNSCGKFFFFKVSCFYMKIMMETCFLVFFYNWVFLENEIDTFKSNSQLSYWKHEMNNFIAIIKSWLNTSKALVHKTIKERAAQERSFYLTVWLTWSLT